MILSALIAAAALQGTDQSLVVTAARAPLPADAAAASATVYDEATLDDLAFPAVADLLRLAPGVAVAIAGPRGTQAQVRIRGAEANHSLLFLDGIRFNDPAAANEARFELLAADSLSRLEILRGPQSALWGSEALGGVIAARTADPFLGRGFEGRAEQGSLDTSRLAGAYAGRAGAVGFAASAGWQRSDGIDSFGAGGERDGFENRAAAVKVEARPSATVRFGVVGHYIEGDSEYDGFDPATFRRADTLDETENRIAAVRGWAAAERDGWAAQVEASYLDSANRNLLAGAPLNRTFGDRTALGAQVSRRIGGHLLIAAVEHQAEDFRARDTAFFGATEQDRGRSLTALVGEWRAEWSPALVTDLAVRRDAFSAFADATTWRASILVRPTARLALHAAYGEGIAQPSFFDLYGFFPGAFVGNPDLRPERSRGWEAGLRWRGDGFELAATGFSARLSDEIVETFDPVTFLAGTANATGQSRRDGVELVAGWRHAPWLQLSAHYTYLDADEQRVAGAVLLREVRRPRHSAALVAHGAAARLRWGASLAYVGERSDTDFDRFPAATVILDDYLLASLNVAFRILPQLELLGRVENGFDADHRDVVGYATPGRTVHAGLRVLLGR